MNWSFRISQFLNMRTRYQYTRSKNTSLPYFAGRTNVSAEAGIVGNNQDPLNWGPPSLRFASDIAGLSDGRYSRATHRRTHVVGSEIQSFRGRHTMTIGGEYRRIVNDICRQQDPRGTFDVHGARDRVGFRRLPARPAADGVDRLRQRRQVLPQQLLCGRMSPTTGA